MQSHFDNFWNTFKVHLWKVSYFFLIDGSVEVKINDKIDSVGLISVVTTLREIRVKESLWSKANFWIEMMIMRNHRDVKRISRRSIHRLLKGIAVNKYTTYFHSNLEKSSWYISKSNSDKGWYLGLVVKTVVCRLGRSFYFPPFRWSKQN